MISYEDFVKRAAESFAFLEDEFGFRRVAENSQAPEAWLKYESDDRRVIVHFEAGSGTWVELAELERSGPNSVILRRDFNLELGRGAVLGRGATHFASDVRAVT